MKKTFALIIHIITFTPCIFTMHTEKALICASKQTNALFNQSNITNELNNDLLNCISREFYLPNTMQELITKGADGNSALFYVWRQIRAPKIPDISDAPITKILANTSQILDFNRNLKKQFKFLCEKQAFDEKTLTEIQSLKTMIKSMTITLQEFDSLNLSTNDHATIEQTTFIKGIIMEQFLQSLANRLEKNQPLHNTEQEQS